nr:cache domain-containing protein [Synergistaceae bacterium]
MNSLRGRLITVFLVMALAAMGIIGFFAVNRSSNALIDVSWKEGDARASELGTKINAYLRGRIDVLEVEAEQSAIRGMNWEEQEPALAPLYDRFDFLDIFVADSRGEAAFVHRDVQGVNVKDRDYFKQAFSQKKAVISNPIENRATGDLTFVYAVPILGENGAVAGVLVASENLEAIAREVSSIQWGEKGYAFLADTRGILVAHPVKELVGKLNISEPSDKIAPELAAGMRRGLEGNSGRVEYYFNGIDQMNAYAPVPLTGWITGITAPQEQFLAPVRALRNIILVAS